MIEHEMSEHTPGPWRAEQCAVYGPGTPKGRDTCIAAAINHYGYGRANARLIAAAPNMLAAAREIDRLLLVIESAVRNADHPHWEAVVRALKANNAAIGLAVPPHQRQEEHQ